LSRIEFGNSLLNTPVGTNLGNLGFLQNPRDISILKTCDDFFGLLVTRDDENEIVVLEFGNSIENFPTPTSLGGFSEFEFPHALTTSRIVAEGIAVFVGSVDNKNLSRIILSSPSAWNVDCQSTLSDFNLSYAAAGTYDFQLIVNDGLPTQTSFCKSIVVLPTPNLDLGSDTTLCVGETLSLATGNMQTTWQDNQAIGSNFEVSETNLYTAIIEGELCNSYDSVFVEFKNCENCLLFPNAFTPDQDGVNDLFKPVLDCEVEFVTFHLQIYNRWGQKVFETNNPLEGWDGNFNGKFLTSDVYVWKSSSSYTKGENIFEKTAHGDLTLIR
jgi:gliding motility-associated-like protein